MIRLSKLLIFVFVFSATAEALAGAKSVEESFWISSKDSSIFNLLKSRPELTLDHIKDDGFELYGPKGLKKFLVNNNIPHSTLKIASFFAKAMYPTPEEIEKELISVTKNSPQISRMFSIGKTNKNRDLWVIKISKDVNVDDNRPEFKFIANMHGDEIVGRELMVRLIKDLLSGYGKDPVITNLIDRVQIYIMPSMNPDGAARSTRGNAKNIDLNRDFPDFSTTDNANTLEGRQVETQAVMKWQKTRNFVLSANFHGGAEVVNYPWDTIAESFEREAEIKDLSLEYAGLAPYIGASTVFNNGITNGYAWYEVNGGMQDWSIYYQKDLQVTIEVSDDKWPSYSMVDYYYKQNKPALLKFIERALN